nr:MAG TPA: receptor binding protein [Caudoviricetes sp.]
MPQTLSKNLQLIDPIGADKDMYVKDALNLIAGVGTESNIYKINELFTDVDEQIAELEDRNALTDVNATYASTSGNVAAFNGVVADIDSYRPGMVLILTLPQTNAGGITLNINDLGAKAVKKYDDNGSLMDLEAGDFVLRHKYFIEYDGTQFVLLCENDTQKLKNLDNKIDTHIEDEVVHITGEERTSWNGKSVVTASEENGKINVDGAPVTVYTHPEGTNPHGTTKADVGLGNVANERQYSAENPPPYPVTSVNGKTGAAVLKTSDIENDLNYQTGDDVSGSVTDAINALKGSVPEALNTLQKLAAAINNDANYHTTVDNALDGKAAKDLSNVENATLLDKGKAAGLLDSATAATTYVAKDTYDADQELLEDDIADLQTNKADKTELLNKVISVTLTTAGWTSSVDGIYSQGITNSAITANMKLNLALASNEMMKTLADAGVYGLTAVNDNGTASVLAYGEQPTMEIPVQIELVAVTTG